MFLTEEMRRRLIVYAVPRYKVKQTDYGNNWRVVLGESEQPVAVFKDWSDAVAFARWKAAP